MNIEQVLNSGGVDRYHSNPFVPNQKLSDHLWKVGLLVKHFGGSPEAILLGMTHDCPEAITGDTPSPAKKMQPALKVLLDHMEDQISKDWGIVYKTDNYEAGLVKNCDIIEGIHYCATQVRMGNNMAIPTLNEWLQYYKTRRATTHNIMNIYVEELIKGLPL